MSSIPATQVYPGASTFHFPKYVSTDTKALKIAVSDFALILDGIELYGAVRRNRYRLSGTG